MKYMSYGSPPAMPTWTVDDAIVSPNGRCLPKVPLFLQCATVPQHRAQGSAIGERTPEVGSLPVRCYKCFWEHIDFVNQGTPLVTSTCYRLFAACTGRRAYLWRCRLRLLWTGLDWRSWAELPLEGGARGGHLTGCRSPHDLHASPPCTIPTLATSSQTALDGTMPPRSAGWCVRWCPVSPLQQAVLTGRGRPLVAVLQPSTEVFGETGVSKGPDSCLQGPVFVFWGEAATQPTPSSPNGPLHVLADIGGEARNEGNAPESSHYEPTDERVTPVNMSLPPRQHAPASSCILVCRVW